MQYALIGSNRHEPFPRGRGICPMCGSGMIAKCGPHVLHHWAHEGRKNCDPWWENETEWHRTWKNLFPEECREVSLVASDGEIHRADIRTPTGIYIEVQHSAMTDVERDSREGFYRNLIWIIDGRAFLKNFDVLHELPDPNSEAALDIVWFKAKRPSYGAAQGIYYRLSETRKIYPDRHFTKANIKANIDIMVKIHSIREIKADVDQAYRGHHQYDWIRPRRTWLDATCPVYIDFGNDHLARLEIYDESNLPCIRYITKKKFLHDVMVETDASRIATRFYPLPG
ncbi:MAG: CoiA-like domain protein [Magnetococcales bacterium]|nr:CoiA-like domain protein [Magnetococcales bacterium]